MTTVAGSKESHHALFELDSVDPLAPNETIESFYSSNCMYAYTLEAGSQQV